MRHQSLGEAFAYLGPFLKLYSTYANNFQEAGRTLQEWLKKSAEFASFVLSQEARPECCGLSLSSLLITPVQRVPRYKLLLDDLLKRTRPSHIDYAKLKAASTEVALVADHINEHIRQHENFSKMLSIQHSLSGSCVPGILSPGRRFLLEGRLMKVCRRKAKERMVFLFSDILIYATPTLLEKKDQQRSYECRCVFPLLNSAVSLVESDHRAPGVRQLFKVSNSDTSLLFFSSREDEVTQWAQAIENTIRELQQAYGSLMNSQKVVLHPLIPPPCTGLVPADREGEEGEEGEERGHHHLEVMESLQATSDGTMTPCTPYPLTSTLFTTSSRQHPHKDHTPSPRHNTKETDVFVFKQPHLARKDSTNQDHKLNPRIETSPCNQEGVITDLERRGIGSRGKEKGDRDCDALERERETDPRDSESESDGDSVAGGHGSQVEGEHDVTDRTSLLPDHLDAMSTGSLSTINLPDSQYSRCCTIL